MKIGQFAKLNEVSVDTIRHYMDMGLIVPEKKGGQYNFDNRCQEDLEMISEFKAMGFQLNEIKLFFFYKNIGKLTEYEEDAYYQSLFLTKRDKVEKEINTLQQIKEKLDRKLEQLSKRSYHSKANTGIQIHSLNWLKCSNCGQSLSLENGSISQNQVIEGILSCGCELEHTIQSGIIVVNQPFIPSPDDLQLESHMNEYIMITDSDYLQNIYNSLQWSKRKLDGLNLQQKVLLELGSGVGIFLRNMYDDLPEDCLYIAVDHNLEKLRFLKGILERTNLKRNVLFICADFMEIPIVHHSIDILIDHTGSSNYSFENESFLLKKVNHLVKENGYLLGSFFIFNRFSSKSKITPKVRSNFSFPIIKNHIVELKYELIEEKASDILNHGGKYEDFFVKGEEVYTYSYFGKRSG
ncbi:MerR family transcriptional regulator [Bacillus sp. DNRA2]|uniref:MerR family transcriptional regulator n=1 Tax=Bacillus sp. DNRA2 TaxID=2723053 RepID=UPI00145D4799|nr:MerR family transcriptional regulator [Bacillus sp. DNRA2]NMD71626.1 MerR family transcriptional regulator [Bacillus sp. DNRA2]